jgi:hypothetical protein
MIDRTQKAADTNSKLDGSPYFISYKVSCLDQDQEEVSLVISPFTILIAADIIRKNDNIGIKEGFSEAMVGIIENINKQYTITKIGQYGKDN